MLKLIIRIILLGALAACSKAPAPPVGEAPKPAYLGAGTVMQDQLKVLDDAKKVEQQNLDAEARRRAEFDQ